MSRARISTTVDGELLAKARQLGLGPTDAALFDRALQALLASHRASEIDEAYREYERQPLDQPDAWGDLAAFREAAARS